MDNRRHNRVCHATRLAFPAVVTEVVDVTVGAVEIASTGRLDKYGVDLPIQDEPLPVVAVVGPVVGRIQDWLAQPNLLDQPLQHDTVYLRR